MWKTLNKATIRCPAGFSEKIIASFQMKKISNWHRKLQKTQNFQFFKNFSKLLQLLGKFSTDFVGWSVENGQQGNKMLSSRLFRRVCFSLWIEKSLKLLPKTTKNRNFSNFLSLMELLSKFWQTFWFGVFKVRIRCPEVFCEDIIAVFRMKFVSNWHRKWQKFRNFAIFIVFLLFSKFLDFHHFWSIFVKLSIHFVDQNVETPQHWENVLFQWASVKR